MPCDLCTTYHHQGWDECPACFPQKRITAVPHPYTVLTDVVGAMHEALYHATVDYNTIATWITKLNVARTSLMPQKIQERQGC